MIRSRCRQVYRWLFNDLPGVPRPSPRLPHTSGRIAQGLSCALLLGACSLTIDAERVQCSKNSDCTQRGGRFTGSICVDAICRANDSRDAAVNKPDACVGARCDAGNEGSPGSLLPDTNIECRADNDCLKQGLRGYVCVENACFKAGAPIECELDEECAERGIEYVDGRCVDGQCRPNPRWRCESTGATDKPEIQLDVFVRDSVTLEPIRDSRVLVCKKLDITCGEPVLETTTNKEGHVLFTVKSDFAGYLQFDKNKSYAPAIYQLPPYFPADGKLQPAPLLGAGLVDSLAELLGSKLDPARGNMMLVAEDCFGMPLPGVSFETKLDAKAVQLYVRDLLPTTTVQETDVVGNGGFLNYSPGNAVIGTVLRESGLKLSTVSLLVRPGFITVAYIRPELRTPELR